MHRRKAHSQTSDERHKRPQLNCSFTAAKKLTAHRPKQTAGESRANKAASSRADTLAPQVLLRLRTLHLHLPQPPPRAEAEGKKERGKPKEEDEEKKKEEQNERLVLSKRILIDLATSAGQLKAAAAAASKRRRSIAQLATGLSSANESRHSEPREWQVSAGEAREL